MLRERLQFALGMLDKRDARARISGAAELIELARVPEVAAEIAPRLAQLLDDELPELRAAACAGLANLDVPAQQVELLERATRDEFPEVRREATRALGSLENRAAQNVLVRALRDDGAQVRFEAAVGLALLGDAAGVEELLAGVGDRVRRFGALGALAKLGEPRAKAPAEALLRKRFFVSDFERAQAAGLLAKLGSDEGRAYLLDRVARTRADERGLAMELCGEHRLTAAIPVLRAALADARDLFRGTAARSLGLLHDAESAPALIAMAGDDALDLGVRCDAMEGLMFLRTPDALAALHALSARPDAEVRDAANDALAWLQHHPAEDA